MSVEELTRVLWRERDLLEMLRFKLDVESLLLASGRSRWVARATREAEVVVETLRQTEVLRAAVADAVAEALAQQPGATLQELAEACEEPWRTILLDHHDALLSSTVEIARLGRTNRQHLAAHGAAAEASVPAPNVTPARGRPHLRLRDGGLAVAQDVAEDDLTRIAFQAAVPASVRRAPSSLVEFLR